MLEKKYRINTLKKLIFYIKADAVSLQVKRKLPSIIPMKDHIWKFEILLRITEYLSNKQGLWKIVYGIFYFIYKYQCRIFSVEIPLNCIREGLLIWHLSNIIINDKARIGRGVSLSSGVIIGSRNDKVAIVGDFCILMLGAKVLGAGLVSNVIIGAGAVQLSDIHEEFSVWAGVPAKKISNNYGIKYKERKKLILNVKY